MKIKSIISFWLICILMGIFLILKILILVGLLGATLLTHWIEFICLGLFIPIFWVMIRDYMSKAKDIRESNDYREKLSKVLIDQSHNKIFYEGNIGLIAKELTKNVSEAVNADRCSIWLYNEDRSSIICEQLYLLETDSWETDSEVFRADYPTYFELFERDRIIIANDATTHPATACFKDNYLTPLGVRSLLEVPIIYRGEMIGIIAIDTCHPREWSVIEIEFAQLLSSLYSFAYSIKENVLQQNRVVEIEKFIDRAALVSRTDAKGLITYVNKRFEEVSGYKSKELVGKKHTVLSSGQHGKDFWSDMCKKTMKERKVWNSIIINKTKKNQLFYTDTYIKAEYDEDDALVGFMSIRYDVTDVIRSAQEISKKNTYLEYAAKMIRHDMHSGINTYIPRGVSSLRRRLDDETIQKFKLESPLRMIEEGLSHTQKVYKGVYDFTNLVKKDVVLNKEVCDLKVILLGFLGNTSYRDQVVIEDLVTTTVNESLFCTAIDNLIRNGLKYNDSDTKIVRVYMENKNTLVIQDNGRGLTQDEFNLLSKPYTRKANQKETGSGLGLNICVAILTEHGFTLTCEKNNIGTKMKIKL